MSFTKPPVVVSLGGTGVIGSALAEVLEALGIQHASFSLSDNFDTPYWTNISIDFEQGISPTFEEQLRRLVFTCDVQAILDIVGVPGPFANVLATLARETGIPVGLISTCLLYDHAGSGPVNEDCPSFHDGQAMFPYHTSKTAAERRWRHFHDLDLTMFRTHHVLGRGALLGCIPNHNRDPDLLKRLRSGLPLYLAGAGKYKLSFVHPHDLASVIADSLLRRKNAGQVVNVVHPVAIKAADYFTEIANQLGVPMVEIEDFEIDPSDFWSCTARDNVFVSKWANVSEWKFQYGIRECIKDALSMGETEYSEQGAFLRKRAGLT